MKNEKRETSSKISCEELELLLTKGFEWLSKKISQTMELANATTTSMAIIAYCEYDYLKFKTHIDMLKEKLLSLQKKEDGSWNNELWDTGWALRAIATEHFCSGSKTLNFAYPPIRNALTFIEDTKNIRNNWQGELYESIATAFSLLKMNHQKEYPFVKKAVKWIMSKQYPEGCWIDIYDTCFAVRLAIEAQNKLQEDFANNVSSALTWLRRWNPENEKVWTNSNLLLCYLDAGLSTSDPLILNLYTWLFENQVDGCWSSYEDEQAQALMAILELRRRLPRTTRAGTAEGFNLLLGATDIKEKVENELKSLKYAVRKKTKISHSDIEFDIVGEKGILKTTLLVVRICEKSVDMNTVTSFIRDVKTAKETESSIVESWICSRDFLDEACTCLSLAQPEMNRLGISVKMKKYQE